VARRAKVQGKAAAEEAPELTAPAEKAAEKADGSPKNERVLHTRIPANLEEDIKRAAEKLRIPVSNLVRNILQDAVSLLSSVQKNVGDRVHSIRNQAGDRLQEFSEAIRGKHPSPEILAWQPIEVTAELTCASCEKPLAPGDSARMGIAADPAVRVFHCPACAGKSQKKRPQPKGTEP
jgi:hypothetical protein